MEFCGEDHWKQMAVQLQEHIKQSLAATPWITFIVKK
jgi:hypothetical protein